MFGNWQNCGRTKRSMVKHCAVGGRLRITRRLGIAIGWTELVRSEAAWQCPLRGASPEDVGDDTTSKRDHNKEVLNILMGDEWAMGLYSCNTPFDHLSVYTVHAWFQTDKKMTGQDRTWHDMTSHDMTWHGMAWHDRTGQDREWEREREREREIDRYIDR